MFDSASYQAFSDALNELRPGWSVNDNRVDGPDGAVVRLAQRHHSLSLGHYDIEFILDATSPRPVGIWDCVGGFGSTEAERAGFAARLWSLTTAVTVLELKYSGRGDFADHYRGSEPDGFTGWHAIAGAIIGFGADASATALQQWWVANPPLPAIARALVGSLNDDSGPYGLKILFGGEGVGEVRVNGEAHDGASRAVAALPWPRLQPPAFVRSFVILVHRDPTS